MSNPRHVASAVAEAPHEAMAWGYVCDPDREDSDSLEFSLFSFSPPIECKRSAKTL